LREYNLKLILKSKINFGIHGIMQEPAYILKNGRTVPYIPGTITTNREAYAASLHVLFKHVADFHICIVRTFSTKYGIPEDDILKTIQESDEFKNMQVDPVLDMDINSLGYLAEVLAPEQEVPDSKSEEVPVPVPEKKEVPVPLSKTSKVKKTKNAEPEPVAVIATEESRPVEERESDSAIKTKTIRKKIVAPKAVDPIPIPAPIVVADDPVVVTKPESDPIKTIRKKIVQKPTQPIAEPIQPISEPVKAASSVPTAGDAPRKIIKKKAPSAT